jgi:DNA-binding SARP family transcriptional activator
MTNGVIDTAGHLGLLRHRLTARLTKPADFRVGWVVGPAGSGKSRLLAHAALSYEGPVAWCGSPDPIPRTERGLAEWLWDGLAPALATPGNAAASLQTVIEAVAVPGPPVLLVVDDVHLLEGSDAEAALAELVRSLPARLRLLLASRVDLAFDFSRLRVSGQLAELGPDDLRFRTWEVEELFRAVYGEALIPEDVATLARRTAGWAAYLQLFHLATARKSQGERRRFLASLNGRSALVHEYLTRHVLADLPGDMREFLVRTCVLRRPTTALCDELLGWSAGSRERLAELERRQLFTERVDEETYSYHPVLLSYLEARLVETLGSAGARHEHHRAAILLERQGLTEDAAAAFAKAEDWKGVARALGHPDSSAADFGWAWLEALPPAVVESDALLLMARARRALASGTLADAVATMRAAESVAASSAIAERCRRERDMVAVWAGGGATATADWLGLVRRATQDQPKSAKCAACSLPGPTGRFAQGVAAFLSGDMLVASSVLHHVVVRPDTPPTLATGSRLVELVAAWMCGRAGNPADRERLRDAVDELGVPWVDRMARAVLLATADAGASDLLDELLDACRREADEWGEALVAFVSGLGCLWKGQPRIDFCDRAARMFRELGAGVLEAFARLYMALSAYAVGDPTLATESVRAARSLTSSAEVPAAAGLAALALGRAFGDDMKLAEAKELLEPLGIWEWHKALGVATKDGDESGPTGHWALLGDGPATGGNPVTGGGHAAPEGAQTSVSDNPAAHVLADEKVFLPTRLRCFGAFSLTIDGRPVDESAAKPMERALLHLLAMHAGERVHREVLMEALWPECEPNAGLHRLHVAVSSLRCLIGHHQGGPVVERVGNAYRLGLGEGSQVDIWEFGSQLNRASRARSMGQVATEEEALAAALAVYAGPLLPADGPANWVVSQRAMSEARAVDAAARLARLRLDNGQHSRAAETARVGLAIDAYRDELWEVLIEAAQLSGHHAEAGQARRSYAAVLGELGV